MILVLGLLILMVALILGDASRRDHGRRAERV